jgi:riboflavin biosynthesis pyrimidine reductase
MVGSVIAPTKPVGYLDFSNEDIIDELISTFGPSCLGGNSSRTCFGAPTRLPSFLLAEHEY